MNKAKLQLMLVSLGAAVILGSPAARSQSGVVHSGPQPSAGPLANYWTADRMKAAKPKDPGPLVGPAPATPSAAPVPSGNPGTAGGMLPTVAGRGETELPRPSVTPERQSLLSSPKPASTVAPASGSFPGPNATYYYGPKFRTYPISTVGVLFFTEPSGDFSCTASVTTGSASILNVIWTAGHCVANGGHSQFYTNWMFCPSYDGEINPAVGCWAGQGANTTTAWFADGAFSRDFAVVFLASSGTLINNQVANVTGSLGFSWNQADDQAWQHYGYPGQSPWTFGNIVTTTTEYRYSSTPLTVLGATDTYGPAVNSWGSGQTPGSSGSALMLNFCYYDCSPPYINSNVSFYYSSGPNGNEDGLELQGPYFDTFACTFWQGATGYTGTC
jgi:hypothetical protein